MKSLTFSPSTICLVLSEIHSSLIASLTRQAKCAQPLGRAKSTRIAEPSASITSIELGLGVFPRTSVKRSRLRGQSANRTEIKRRSPAARNSALAPRYEVISMSSPRPQSHQDSGTPATSVTKRTQRVHWMHRFIEVLTSAPIYLSSTARLFWDDENRSRSTPSPGLADRIRRPGRRSGSQAEADEQKQHAFAALAIGELVMTTGGSARPGARSLTATAQTSAWAVHLSVSNKAHPAVASNRQPLVETAGFPSAASQAWRRVYSAGTSSSLPSIARSCSCTATQARANELRQRDAFHSRFSSTRG